jgi:hypothetical protein
MGDRNLLVQQWCGIPAQPEVVEQFLILKIQPITLKTTYMT